MLLNQESLVLLYLMKHLELKKGYYTEVSFFKFSGI